MPDSEEDEMYDTFEQYKSNDDILEQINKGIRGENLSEIYHGSVSEYMVNGTRIIEDSITLKKYLLHFNTIESCNKDNCCVYLNYWLNKKARMYSNSSNFILTKYNAYMNEDSELKEKGLCISKINHMDTNKYEQMKELYKIYEQYKYYKYYKLHNHNEQIACNRVKYCATEYNNILSKYPTIEDTKFCKVLKNFKDTFENDDWVSNKKCNSEIPHLLSYEYSCIQLQVPSSYVHGSSLQDDRQMEIRKNSEESSYYKLEQTERSAEEQSHSPSSSDSTLPITLFSSGVGILLFLMSSYKFTPLGQWLRFQTRRFKGISEQYDEEQYEIQQHNSEFEERNTEYDEYNITYSSL
ncbi:PIR Superfamily Protein [Plasmodium ovale curtisi]|uniref:PIR Superfamily Protein n=1 Tax=Plasmodium ovale curtisi TaxID=864141 RepID=A0A1A8X8W0_PLAOA|nr:PIR Superfamily Protein [Plasmodium ovale curtisi]SBT01677.1 PIR Superfamily Protein [Plasmodium ovale curtisi]